MNVDSPNMWTDPLLLCAVWVWCGDKERCKGSYRDCWLKHLVRTFSFIVSAVAAVLAAVLYKQLPLETVLS